MQQLYDETSASYITRLCNLAKTCNFGNEKENNLRDQLVYGCHDDSLRKKLFHEETLTLHTAGQFGQKQTPDSATVNKVIEGQGRQKGFAAAGQHGSLTNCPGPGQVQVLWSKTRL